MYHCCSLQVDHLRSVIKFRFGMGIIDTLIAKCERLYNVHVYVYSVHVCVQCACMCTVCMYVYSVHVCVHVCMYDSGVH